MKLRFTIRDLFWLTLVMALAVWGALEHRRADREHQEAQKIASTLKDIIAERDALRDQAIAFSLIPDQPAPSP
jgi:hypothetical protein